MSAYTGYLIRRERLAQNLSQEGLAKGICATSYLSKIEQGLVEPGEEIIDRLFAALGIDFVRDPALEAEAARQLERYLFLKEADEPAPEQEEFLRTHSARLLRSEFALGYQVFQLIFSARPDSADETRPLLVQIEPFMPCLSARLRQWVLLVKAEYQEKWSDEWAALEQAAQLGSHCLVTYKRANCAYRRGNYSLSVELAEQAYSQAAYEGNTAAMIWSCFLLGSCACNRYDLEQVKRYYQRVLALTRGHRLDLSSYINYNLGSTYLELGDDDSALRCLEKAEEKEQDEVHNTLLHQKLAILCQRQGERERGLGHLEQAKACLKAGIWPERHRMNLIEKMVRFAELTFESAPMELPEFEQVTRELYDEAGEAYGFGFKHFYGRYLVALYKSQRRYKEALLVQEEMDA